MNKQVGSRIKSVGAAIIVTPIAIVAELFRAVSKRFKVTLLHQRRTSFRFLAANSHSISQIPMMRPKVLAVISHLTSLEEASNAETGKIKIERLAKTIDGLQASLAHCDLHIVVSTLSQRHITCFLPDHHKHMIEVEEQKDCDPVFLGFRAQDEFLEHSENFDWFMFIEDDMVVHDSYLLEKLTHFNRNCGLDAAVLLPNRYEMWNGSKVYIDTVNHYSGEEFVWNRLSSLEMSSVNFGECENAHAGFYCLSQSQLQTWIRSGRYWYNKATYIGPLESAATGCLLECFSLYKASPKNLHYFEIQHWDTKYAPLIQAARNKMKTVIS